MNMRKRSGQLAMVVMLVALVGCDKIGNPFVALGSKPPAPDEFQVITRKPLMMPLTGALPEPRLGTPSPLDPNPSQEAEVALLGTTIQPVHAPASPGEAELLAAASSVSAKPVPDIRKQLLLDTDFKAANDTYVPPSIFELFGLAEAPPEDVIDPKAEARRLQSEGLAAAPIDPSDRPTPTEEVAVVEQPSKLPPLRTDRRPNNRPLSTVEPAYQ